MILRPPRLDELPYLSDLCLRSKAVWDYDEAMLDAFKDELTLTEDDLESDVIIVAEDLRGVAGGAQLSFDETGSSYLDKLFVEPVRLGEGTGKMLYVWACRYAQGSGAKEMVIEADPDAAPFYVHMGAEPAGEAESGSIPGRLLPRLVHKL
ncbi:GNAT family N-acetyltransferase [uncultured Hyphomonas sp.]|uniref:GNAT family N-acetyltransferase n=3 Tax=Hyphomonas TaxID=85 RepID=UPI00260606A1|nr:GNAT family N-acetyltransferase [uncultured Hyphomonas sp.]